MKLIGFLFRGVLFVGLTFAFLVLFQSGGANFGEGARKEWNYWRTKIAPTSAEN